jgi:hypothetical protein
VNWDFWVHLFCAELHTLATGKVRTCWAIRAGGLTLTMRDTRKELYPMCTMTSNNAGLPPYTGKVLMAKTDTWHHGVSPHARQGRLESLTTALQCLADAGLGAASTIANFHHRRVVPLMES